MHTYNNCIVTMQYKEIMHHHLYLTPPAVPKLRIYDGVHPMIPNARWLDVFSRSKCVMFICLSPILRARLCNDKSACVLSSKHKEEEAPSKVLAPISLKCIYQYIILYDEHLRIDIPYTQQGRLDIRSSDSCSMHGPMSLCMYVFRHADNRRA